MGEAHPRALRRREAELAPERGRLEELIAVLPEDPLAQVRPAGDPGHLRRELLPGELGAVERLRDRPGDGGGVLRRDADVPQDARRQAAVGLRRERRAPPPELGGGQEVQRPPASPRS